VEPELSEADQWRESSRTSWRSSTSAASPRTGFTYDKFEQTLKKNRDTLVQRHGAKRVKFSVYVKDGKAASRPARIKD